MSKRAVSPDGRLSRGMAARGNTNPPAAWKQNAAAFITDAGKWSADQLRETATEISASILKELRPEVTRAEAAAKLSVRMAWVAGSVGAIAVAGLAEFMLAGLGHG